MTLSRKIVIALGAGIGCGIFFGELCSALAIVGDAYIALMQMTVLPYIVLALIVNIGDLTIDNARRLAGRAAVVLFAIWFAAIAVILLLGLGLPEWKTGGFFSESLLQPADKVDFIGLYIPANPFFSLAQNIVPGVVLFCICIGVALIGIDRKAVLIGPARVLLEALTTVTHAIAKLTPYGVFAIAANASGSITMAEIDRLQGYMIIYGAATLILTFLVLPMAVAVFTPFGYREILSASRGPLLTAFAANNYFIVLPMLIENLKALYHQHGIGGDEVDRTIDITLPIGFPFPNTGRLLALVFIPFAAWYVGRPLMLLDYPKLVLAGLPSLFAKVTIAVPYLLDLMRLPADLFHLFLLTGIVNGHLSSMVGAMHLFAYTAIATAWVVGELRFHRRLAVASGLATAIILVLSIVSTRSYLGWFLATSEDQNDVLRRMKMISEPADATIIDVAEPHALPLTGELTRLDRVRQHGAIRVCYLTDNLPFSYRNDHGDLVGFDVEMAHRLALDLDVDLELIPVNRPERAAAHLEADHCDLLMSGFGTSASHLLSLNLSQSYLELTPALVVPDHLRADLASLDGLIKSEGLRIGVVNDEDIIRTVNRYLPYAEAIEIARVADFFESEQSLADVLVLSAEAGSAWTLIHPEFQVVFPFDETIRWPLAYPVAAGDQDFRRFVDHWIDIMRSDGLIRNLRDYWILGKNAVPQRPRWSVIRDVLHWID